MAIAVALLLATASGVNGSDAGGVTATVQVSQVDVVLQLPVAQIAVGESVKVEAVVTNLGRESIRSVTLELRVDESGLGVRGGATKGISQLRPGAQSGTSWNVCGRAPGFYIVLASVSVGEVTLDSEAHVLEVTPGNARKPC